MYTQHKEKVIHLHFFPNLFKKRNLERILFILIHSVFNKNRTPIEPGLPVYAPMNGVIQNCKN